MVKINPVNGYTAREFAFTWDYPEFGDNYVALIEELNYCKQSKKLVRFFDDFNYDLKKSSSRPKAAFIIRIGDYLRRISDMVFEQQVSEEIVSRFLRHFWLDLVRSSCKPKSSEDWEMWGKYYRRKGKDPHFRVFVGLRGG